MLCGTTKENVDDEPHNEPEEPDAENKRDVEELEMVTGDRSTDFPNSTEDCDLELSDFALNLCQRFAVVRFREDLAIVYRWMAGKGMDEVCRLVAAHILSWPATPNCFKVFFPIIFPIITDIATYRLNLPRGQFM